MFLNSMGFVQLHCIADQGHRPFKLPVCVLSAGEVAPSDVDEGIFRKHVRTAVHDAHCFVLQQTRTADLFTGGFHQDQLVWLDAAYRYPRHEAAPDSSYWQAEGMSPAA